MCYKNYNNKKIAFVNKSNKIIKLDFKYDEIKDKDIDVVSINKSDILKNYDFILIYDKKNKKRNE